MPARPRQGRAQHPAATITFTVPEEIKPCDGDDFEDQSGVCGDWSSSCTVRVEAGHASCAAYCEAQGRECVAAAMEGEPSHGR